MIRLAGASAIRRRIPRDRGVGLWGRQSPLPSSLLLLSVGTLGASAVARSDAPPPDLTREPVRQPPGGGSVRTVRAGV
jgi:hypothetical protein